VNRSESRAAISARSSQPRLAANVASLVVLGVEVIGSAMIWGPLPLAWIWVAARIVDATRSIAAGGCVALLGLTATTLLAIAALNRIDDGWVTLRRRAGHDQAEGALTQVVVVSVTLLLVVFAVWSIVNNAMIIPFMPTT
jgi:multisubunit Na+/H+ antiporter MnhB subunit